MGYELLDFIKVLFYFDPITSVGVLPRFNDPAVLASFVLRASYSFTFVIMLVFGVLRVWNTRFNMKSQRQCIKNIFFFTTVSIVVSHIDKQRFFVVQMLIKFKSIVYFLHLFSTLLNLYFYVCILWCLFACQSNRCGILFRCRIWIRALLKVWVVFFIFFILTILIYIEVRFITDVSFSLILDRFFRHFNNLNRRVLLILALLLLYTL